MKIIFVPLGIVLAIAGILFLILWIRNVMKNDEQYLGLPAEFDKYRIVKIQKTKPPIELGGILLLAGIVILVLCAIF